MISRLEACTRIAVAVFYGCSLVACGSSSQPPLSSASSGEQSTSTVSAARIAPPEPVRAARTDGKPSAPIAIALADTDPLSLGGQYPLSIVVDAGVAGELSLHISVTGGLDILHGDRGRYTVQVNQPLSHPVLVVVPEHVAERPVLHVGATVSDANGRGLTRTVSFAIPVRSGSGIRAAQSIPGDVPEKSEGEPVPGIIYLPAVEEID